MKMQLACTHVYHKEDTLLVHTRTYPVSHQILAQYTRDHSRYVTRYASAHLYNAAKYQNTWPVHTLTYLLSIKIPPVYPFCTMRPHGHAPRGLLLRLVLLRLQRRQLVLARSSRNLVGYDERELQHLAHIDAISQQPCAQVLRL